MEDVLTDFTTWMMDNDDRLYRFWTKVNEEPVCNFGYIAEAVELGGGDVLLGFQIVDNNTIVEDHLEFHRLSDINIEWWKEDKEQLYD